MNIAGGSSNRKMVKLLESFGFNSLYMTHPKTGEDWLDEEGVELELMYRDERLSVDEADALLLSTSSTGRSSSKKKFVRKLQLRRKQHQLKKRKQHQLKKRKLPRKAKGVQQVEEEEVQDAKKKKIFYNSPGLNI